MHGIRLDWSVPSVPGTDAERPNGHTTSIGSGYAVGIQTTRRNHPGGRRSGNERQALARRRASDVSPPPASTQGRLHIKYVARAIPPQP